MTYIKNPNRVYSYNSSNILTFESPKRVNLDQLIVYVSGFPVREPSLVLDFGEYIKIIEVKGKTEVYHKSKVAYENSCLNSKQAKAVFEYFKKLSPYISVTEDGRTALFDLYKKITEISENSVLSTYLSGKSIKKHTYNNTAIFPFGFNLSQKKAVNTALENSISVIEGPPGTGKTQTILNIISNERLPVIS
ncbi:AAA domain-containing protein [Clostridium arbusti]|uniref:AAA domain-containing protein n=1 Tax=Clostridium arbusti TaxID=1137848 RepID=UPI000289D44A|nr:AAA domain-containing protein [Clostridium arbusti]